MDKREAYEIYYKLQAKCFRHKECLNCPFAENLNDKKICILANLDNSIIEKQVKLLYSQFMLQSKNEQLKAKETKEINLTLDEVGAKELNKKIQERVIKGGVLSVLNLAPDALIPSSVTTKKDNVNRPGTTAKGGMECIDVIRAAVSNLSGVEAVDVANVIKYVWRYKDKNGLEDLKKAKHYLEWLIEEVEKNETEHSERH